MKTGVLAGSVLTIFALAAVPAYSATIVDLYASGFSSGGLVSGESWDDNLSTVSGTFNAVVTADYAWVVENEGGCPGNGGFPTGCTTYELTLNVTNQSGQDWTGFVLEFGYGGFWLTGDVLSAFNDGGRGIEDPDASGSTLTFGDSEYEPLDGGQDQPFSLVSTSATPWNQSASIGESIGIKWFDGVLNTGDTATLGISLTIGNITGIGDVTEWENYFFVTKTGDEWVPWKSGSGEPENAQLLTSRFYPTVAAVPEPGPLALIAVGLVALVFVRRRWAL